MHQEKEQSPPHVPETRRVQSTQQETAQSEKTVTEIPLADALRMIVRLRMMVSSQTEAERIEPILMSNRHIADPEEPVTPAPERLVESITTKERQRVSEGSYDGTKHSLKKRFAAHKEALKDKVERLRKEYLALHEAWLVHCAKLDEVARANALEEAAATAGRTTRRSAAMGDAVRTDLEMEQILASLGNEELTDANHLSAKNAADIPDMISVTKGRLDYIFDDTNNLVEDPHSFYALETGIDDWTTEEKAIFIEKYAMYPKQFGIIAQFLPNKTPAQCVTFYYLQKNTTIDFRKVVAQYNTVGKRTRRGRGGKQKGNALLADILKHDDEVSRDANQNGTSGRRRRGAPQTSTPTPAPPPESEAGPSTAVQTPTEPPKKAGVSRRSTTQNTPTGTPDPADSEPANNKRPRRRANPTAKAAAAASLGQDPPEEVVDEDARPAKRARRGRKSKAAEAEAAVNAAVEVESASTAPPTETKFIDQTETARKKSSGGGAVWSDEDKGSATLMGYNPAAQFLDLLSRHGHDFKRIAASMPNKTTIQVTSFYKANHIEMELANVAAKAPKRSPSPTASTSTAPEPTAKPATPPAKTSALPANPEDMPLDADTLNSLRAFLARTSGVPQGSASHGSLPTAPGAGSSSHAKADSSNQLPPTAPHPRKPRAGRGGGRGRAAQAPLPALFTTVPRGAVDPENAEAPDRLETVGDLYRWLEHRTRLNAEQNNDSGFM
ncbi:hypothetical protein BD413DRAFT_606658 [Trametes elegans]|nr:hypothetical protein BD413DRAFT_606658 [Trametes elegans]